MNENTKFDLEWAKRGGFFYLEAADGTIGLLKVIDGINVAMFVDGGGK